MEDNKQQPNDMSKILPVGEQGQYVKVSSPVPTPEAPSTESLPSAERFEFELVELPPPLGDFIFKNSEGILLQDGQYYHYSEVCKLLKLFASLCVEQKTKEWEKEKAEIIKEYQHEVDALKGNLYSKED